jgi:hypothetical protein
MTAAQSAWTPERAAVAAAMSIRLDRQSTSVPKTSNSRTPGRARQAGRRLQALRAAGYRPGARHAAFGCCLRVPGE